MIDRHQRYSEETPKFFRIFPRHSEDYRRLPEKSVIFIFNGCQGSFQKKTQCVYSMAVIGRIEVHWYPNTYSDGTKCWKLGREQRRYYHPNMACLHKRHSWFHDGHLQGLMRRTEGSLNLTEGLLVFIKQCFPGILIE